MREALLATSSCCAWWRPKQPFRGARVRAVDDTQLLPVFPVRAVLEQLAAGEAARNAGRDVAALDRELDAMRKAAAAADWRTQIADDLAFHRAMVELAGNEPLLQSWLVLGVEVSTAFATYQTFWDQSELARVAPRTDHRGDPGR